MEMLRLTFRAFGPYTGTQVIDFRDLAGHHLFLIHGDTGAGKTMILDAICAALYAESSGGKRDLSMLRGQLAAPEQRTLIELDFAIGGETYRVRREPGYEWPGGKAHSRAALFRRTGLLDDDMDGEPIASQWNDVSREIRERLGLNAKQFRQVVMLPQGQFLEFLRASSTEREKILEVLFKTSVYRALEEALEQAAERAQGAAGQKRRELEAVLATVSVKTTGELAAQVVERAAAAEAVGREVATAEMTARAAQGQLEEGRQRDRVLRELADARAGAAACAAGQPELLAARERLVRARLAATLAESAALCTSRRAERAAAEARRDDARRAHTEASAAEAEAAAGVEQEEGRQAERDAALAERDRLAGLQAGIGKVVEAQQAVAALERRLLELERERGGAQAALTEAEAVQTTLDARVAELAAQAEGHAVAQLNVERSTAALRAREELDRVLADLAAAGAALTSAEARVTQLREARAQAYTTWQGLDQAWRRGQSAALAAGLTPGEPCPVCGSLHHPTPARASGPLPGEADLERVWRAVEAHDAEIAAATGVLGERQRAHDQLTGHRDALLAGLSGALPPSLAEARATYEVAQQSVVAAAEAAGALGPARARLQEASLACAQAEKQLTATEAQLRETALQRAAGLAVLEERVRDYPAGLREPEALAAAVGAARRYCEDLEHAREAARQRLDGARLAAARAGQTLTERDAEYADALRRSEEQDYSFAERLAAAGFTSEVEFQCASLAPEALAALERELAAAEERRAAAEERLRRAQEAAGLGEAPDLPTLERLAAEAAAAHAACLERQGAAREQLSQSQHAAALAGDFEGELVALEQRAGQVQRLADIAGGSEQGLSFHRFMLGAIMEEVLISASEHLRVMSRHRYHLLPLGGRKKRSQSMGLDLEVYDAHTDQTRPSESLSGGESFLTALALALGLADIVQSRAGGVHLETIFIDEGFGTLDERSLELALRVLTGLRESGRTVGIISHVPDLPRRIPARLEVRSDTQGSTARFVVGATARGEVAALTAD